MFITANAHCIVFTKTVCIFLNIVLFGLFPAIYRCLPSRFLTLNCARREVFRMWAMSQCPDAKFMNVKSNTQLQQLLFAPYSRNVKETTAKSKLDSSESKKPLPDLIESTKIAEQSNKVNTKSTKNLKFKEVTVLERDRVFKTENLDGFIEPGKTTPLKYRHFIISGLHINPVVFTQSNLPSTDSNALSQLAGVRHLLYHIYLINNPIHRLPMLIHLNMALHTISWVRVKLDMMLVWL